MIINPKRSNFETDTAGDLAVFFLNKEGQLSQEEYIVNTKALVAARDDDLKYGKIEVYGSLHKYYLKFACGGRSDELVIDPYSIVGSPSTMSINNDLYGERFCEYRRVTEQIFNGYSFYLQTRNPLYYNGVRQAILNGDNNV
jgi:hypothetical protein